MIAVVTLTLIAGIVALLTPIAGIVYWILRNYFGQAGLRRQITKKEKAYANLENLLAQAINDNAPDTVLNTYSAQLRLLHKEKADLSARLKKGIFN